MPKTMPKKILLVDNNHEYRHALASIVPESAMT